MGNLFLFGALITLRVFIDHRQEKWPDWLGTAEFAYNNKIHLATKVLPFKDGIWEEKKREVQSGGKVCRKNMENSGGSKSSLKKDSGWNKEVCKQKIK